MLLKSQKRIQHRNNLTLNYLTSTSRKFIDSKPYYFFFKRVFDIFLSSLVIVFILSWFIPLMGIIIKMESRGSILFSQRRIGRGGRIFRCVKFRTMSINMEADIQQAVDNDYRITGIGKFMRRSSIDELPQFLNVFLGHMSVIGPRPHMLTDCRKFSQLIPCYKFRNMVRPGITGLAQIKGFRGPSSHPKAILRRYQYDAFYVRNANFWLDLRIIWVTIIQMTTAFFPVSKSKRIFRQKRAENYDKLAA